MKQILTFLLFSHFFGANGQWVNIPSGTSYDLQDVHFPTDSIGYVVGYYGITLRSVDTGQSWSIVHTDSAKSFQSVFFTSASTGYAAGGSLYKTTDSGIHWEEVMSDTMNQMMEVYFVNDSIGFASGTKLYKTTDGGVTWEGMDFGNTFSSIYFPSDSVGYFIGGPDFASPLYKTTDGGESYVQITNGFQSIKESVHFINDNTGYMCGWYGGIVAKTINGGHAWELLDQENGAQCWGVHFIDEMTGYYINNSGGQHLIKKTKDGGITWTPQLLNTNVGLYAFYFLDQNTIIAVGSLGSIFKTNNGGEITGTMESGFDHEISIYPNPAGDDLFVENRIENSSEFTISLYTMMGQRLMRSDCGARNTQIDISSLGSGVYVAVINDDHQIISVGRILKL